MTVYKILAWDYSGSTINVPYYFKVGGEHLAQFVAQEGDGDNAKKVYLRWDHECEKITLDELNLICQKKEGRGCTYPSQVVSWIRQNVSDAKDQVELWLVTDGEIDAAEIRKCAQLNQGINYSTIKFIVVNQNKINMSVGASFFTGTQLEIFQNSDLFKRINTAQAYDYDSVTCENFKGKWDDLSDYIQAKFMGSDLESLVEMDKLTRMRRRLLEALAEADPSVNIGSKPVFNATVKADLIRTLRECEFYRSLKTPALKDIRSLIDGSVSTLLNYISNRSKSFDFDSLKMDYKQGKMNVAPEVPEPTLEALEDEEPCNFYDAVTLEEERGQPVLLLVVTDLIDQLWVNGSYKKFQFVMECPLFLRLDQCLGHVYLLETYQTLRQHALDNEGTDMITNPLTNQPVAGGLIFSEKADRWNDYVLSRTFLQVGSTARGLGFAPVDFNEQYLNDCQLIPKLSPIRADFLTKGKKVSTPLSLWYYVIWKHCEGKAWIEPDVVDKLKNYAFRRLESTQVRLGFSHLPLEPKEVVPVGVACFYCTEGASILFGQDPELFLQEKLRLFWFVSKQMMEIMDYFKYADLDKDLVKKRSTTFQLLHQLKRIPHKIEKRYFLLQRAFETVDGGFLTYIVKEKTALKHLNLLTYGHKELIPFDFDKTVPNFAKDVLISYHNTGLDRIKLCPETCRPYFVVEEAECRRVPYYKQVLDTVRNVAVSLDGDVEVETKRPKRLDQRKVTSLCRRFIELTAMLRQYPTLDEFKNYVSKVSRLSENTRIRLFPPDVVTTVEQIFAFYTDLNVPVETFVQKSRDSVCIAARVKIEDLLKNDDAIKVFIEEARSLLTDK